MANFEIDGYRKFRASELPESERERLRRALRHDLAVAMTRSVRDNPPEIDVADIRLVLQPGELIQDFEIDAAASCVTCIT